MSETVHVEFDLTVERRSIVLDAIDALLNADETAGAYTCAEAEAIARFLRVYGCNEHAERWLEAHACSDNEEDDVHHDRYLAQRAVR